MSHATETGKPRWLLQLDEMVARDDLDRVERDTLAYVRELLLAPDDDDQATANVLQAVQTYYRETFCPADDPSWAQHEPEHGTLSVIGSIVPHVFEVIEFVPFDDVRNKRLADLVIGLKMQAPEKFDPGNPQLGWHEDAYYEQMHNAYNAYDLASRDDLAQCNTGVNVYTFLARLAPYEMLGEGEVGAWKVIHALERGVEKPAPSHWTTLVQRAVAVIATQFVLHAGGYLTKHANDEQCKTWATKLCDLAKSTPADAEWHLKRYAQEAYVKLVQLRPQLF